MTKTAAESLKVDPELRLERDRTDLHSLRASNRDLDELSDHIQRNAADAAVASLQKDDAIHIRILEGRRILVTGSSGYIGKAMCLALHRLGAVPVGLDIVPGETVAVKADVSDPMAVQEAVKGCHGIFHMAALHAPHATHEHESEFIATNVKGTQNILDAALEEGGIPVVHTSTTSLTISKNVKLSEKRGRIVWLDETSQPRTQSEDSTSPDDGPRNKYGRTKLEAERRCIAAARTGLPCVILRVPRCFPEDVLPDSLALEAPSVTAPNLKANELLGRRSSLLDILTAQLRALTRLDKPVLTLSGRVLTLAAPFPFSRSEMPLESAGFVAFLQERRPEISDLYKKLGWSMPLHLGRVYDSTLAVQMLDWKPLVTFDILMEILSGKEGAAITVEDAKMGRY